MALTPFQQTICRLLSENRIRIGESYVAGGSALNMLTRSPRISRDIDLFHDSLTALEASWDMDRNSLMENGYDLRIVHERSGYIEVVVARGSDSVLIQWTRDSAFRFFPLIQDDILGLTLHPFDLATNKVLALVGRLEIRDWVDMVQSHLHIQHLGLLVWAACGKDPGFGPLSILQHADRSGHYTQPELDRLVFESEPPAIQTLSKQWKTMLTEAREIVGLLPSETAGHCVLTSDGTLFNGSIEELEQHLSAQQILFHKGTIGGAFPLLKP